MRRFVGKVTLSAFACSLLLASPVAAKDEDDEALPAAVTRLAACKDIAEPSARLACYDREATALVAAAEDGTVRIVDKDEVKTIRRSLFGFQLPRIGLFGGDKRKGPEEEEVKLLKTTITRVQPLQYGKVQFVIAEGEATWQTTDVPLRAPKVGEPVEIERAALGSYWVRFERQRSVKGKRVQ